MADIRITNEDCMELLKRTPDNYFDLSICDPPYGIDINVNMGRRKGDKKSSYHKFAGNDSNIPSSDYFVELFRTSKNQIVWGGNYFVEHLENSPCWIVWDKDNGDTDFADCELAWTSFKTSVRKIKWKWAGMLQQDMKNKETRIHPTQKPVKLYEWLLMNYAQRKCDHKHTEDYRHLCTDCRNQDVKILDTHLGSGSIALACHNLGFDLTACELDAEYYDKAMKRIQEHQQQIRMF
jgi:site-specific DNA-methyltransferase (adenine-specific)